MDDVEMPVGQGTGLEIVESKVLEVYFVFPSHTCSRLYLVNQDPNDFAFRSGLDVASF